MNNETSRSTHSSGHPAARSLRRLFAMLCLAVGLSHAAHADEKVAVPFEQLGVPAGQGSLIVAVPGSSFALRYEEGRSFVSLIARSGEFDVDINDLTLEVSGLEGTVTPESLAVATRIDNRGRVEQYDVSAELALGSDDQLPRRYSVSFAIRVTLLEPMIEYRPVLAYAKPGSMQYSRLGDQHVYEYTVVYEAREEVTFALNKTELLDADGNVVKVTTRSQLISGGGPAETDWATFGDSFLPNTSKEYATQQILGEKEFPGGAGMYRSVSIGFDRLGRPFVVEYRVPLNPATPLQ